MIKEKVSNKAKANKAKVVPLRQPICLSVHGLESQVCGIMSNVIVMLISLGWNPAHIYIWESPSGVAFVSGSFLDNTSHLLFDIIDSYNALQFPRVSQHFDGKGIEKGVDFEVTFSLLRAYRRNKSGKEPRWKPEYAESRAAALETAFSGSLWPQSRVSDAFPDVSNECLWCGEPRADSLHDIYLCPHLFESEDSSILETNDLVEEAIEKANSNPCLWFRGIATIDLTQLPEEVMGYADSFKCAYELDPPPVGEWPSGDYFTDGGGGRFSSVASLRKCTIGIAHLVDSVLVFGCRSPLPGAVQTVPRSEVAAVLVLAMHLSCNAVVSVFSDNLVFVNAFKKGYDFCRKMLNSDIYI